MTFPIQINGINIYPFKNYDNLMDYINKHKGILIAMNAEKIMNSNDELKQIINNNVGYADGIGTVWALKRKGLLAVQIPGYKLWLKIINKYEKSKSFYFIGGKENVINNVIKRLMNDYPDINIINYRNGYLRSKKEKQELIKDVCIKKPGIVFAAMGSPQQELLMKDLHTKHPAIYQGLGGSFDVYTGAVSMPPELWVKLGLISLYRTIKQPVLRFKRFFSLLRFIYLCMKNRL